MTWNTGYTIPQSEDGLLARPTSAGNFTEALAASEQEELLTALEASELLTVVAFQVTPSAK